ncbi:hypothetical protein TELCIR_07828 [Teladorsagia circumcincta]|uniref:Ig-like domain-containing protein n=1 Tax=Teladorsagia circumcincta TaxID=45464 RepID=A0A2G9UJB0_TELCI|nr:hypothetical protein TELCIR_07828 [Teladorsagia circumcincta]
MLQVFEAKIKDNKAKLHVGPPVLRLPTGSIFHEVPNARPPKVIGAVKKAMAGDHVELLCPVFSYPEPFARWEKDGAPIGL